MKPAVRLTLLLFTLLAPHAPAAWAEPVPLGSDSTVTMPSGSAFTAPKGWYVSDGRRRRGWRTAAIARHNNS